MGGQPTKARGPRENPQRGKYASKKGKKEGNTGVFDRLLQRGTDSKHSTSPVTLPLRPQRFRRALSSQPLWWLYPNVSK